MKKIIFLFTTLICSACMSGLSTQAETSSTQTQRTGRGETTLPNTNNQKPKGKTPQQLGKEYPKLVQKAKNAVSAMQPDMKIRFPLGVNSPVLINIKEGENQATAKKYEIIGFVDRNKKPQPISTNNLVEMLEQHFKQINNTSVSLQSLNKSNDKNHLANTTNNSPQQKVAVLDIIVVDRETDKVFLIPNVVFISILRDAINAALNKQIKPNTRNVSLLNINSNSQPNQSRQNTTI